MHKYTINQISIDSLKIRIPYEEVDIIDMQAFSRWIKVNSYSGEIKDEDFKNSAHVYEENGVKMRIALEKMKISKNVEMFVVILINAKVLRGIYFEGITYENIDRIYEFIHRQKVIQFPIKSLLDSECTDIDFKKDVLMKSEDFKRDISKLKQDTKPSKEVDKGCKAFQKSNNLGIQWSTRKTTSINTNPFLKFYHKFTELRNNSLLFLDNVLLAECEDRTDVVDLNNIVRIEFTIKNRKHLRMFDIESSRLRTLLKLTEYTKQNMLHEIAKKHIEFNRVKIDKPIKEGLKANDLILFNAIQYLIKSGESLENVLEMLLTSITDRCVRSKKKKFIIELFNYSMPENLKKQAIDNKSFMNKYLFKPNEEFGEVQDLEGTDEEWNELKTDLKNINLSSIY